MPIRDFFPTENEGPIELSTLGVSVGIQSYGGLIYMPDRQGDDGKLIPGGLYAPDPGDSSITKMIYGYAVVPFGNGGNSALETTDWYIDSKTQKPMGGALQIAVHTGRWSWASKMMAFLDPISIGDSGEVKISSFCSVALQVMYIVSVIMLVVCIIVLCLAIIHLFMPG